ncbi:DUF2946 family protein [Noviherbaspirillum aerium]|uniref:DUF2946 family protein n=1 Tax=Noviherbaspirillum aerium TaxID=2588497 RepID=UPI00124D7FF9|nr:DUF2946 family protein [Noviherbaspirillum aerium]
MDDIVKQAMAKWPNVPHCYGWLGLDARGVWRMRDERAQALKLPGDKIANAALLGFINRNYAHDEHGRWYFQNGPQRVYVNLEATPYIVRTDPEQGLVTHTGEAWPALDAAWLTDSGLLVFQAGGKTGMIDDRDMAQCLPQLQVDGAPADDDTLLAWLGSREEGRLFFAYRGRSLPVSFIERAQLAGKFGFVAEPQPQDGEKKA